MSGYIRRKHIFFGHLRQFSRIGTRLLGGMIIVVIHKTAQPCSTLPDYAQHAKLILGVFAAFRLKFRLEENCKWDFCVRLGRHGFLLKTRSWIVMVPLFCNTVFNNSPSRPIIVQADCESYYAFLIPSQSFLRCCVAEKVTESENLTKIRHMKISLAFLTKEHMPVLSVRDIIVAYRLEPLFHLMGTSSLSLYRILRTCSKVSVGFYFLYLGNPQHVHFYLTVLN